MAGREYQLMFRMNAAVNGGFSAAFSGATSSLAQLQSKIAALNKTQNQINQYTRQEQAIQRTSSKLEMLRQQYANLSEEMQRNGDTSADSMNKLLERQNKIEDLTRSLARQQAQYQATGEALRESGVDIGNISGEAERVSQELAEATRAQEEFTAASEETAEGADGAADSLANLAAAAGALEAMKKGVEILKECVKASIEFESAMTGVAKTTDLSAQEYADISKALKDMSTEMPITTTELAGIMETAGQLGIAKEGLVDFTRVMAELGTATNMTSEEAATMLAQFAFVTDMDASKYNNLGSAIVALGNNFATTEKNVTEMAQGIAGIASQAGMTQPEILGIAAAVTSLGEESATGATSMQKVISTLQTAVETGEGLERIASVAGMTADQFRRAWGEDAAGAMQAFIAGLNDVERNGASASMVLAELGMNDARLMRMMLALANSSTSLSSAIQMSNEAWSQGSALATEAATRYGTVESQLQIASNAFNNLKVAIGDAFMPIVAQAAGMVTDILKPITSFIEQNPKLVQAIAAAAGVIGAVTVALTGYAAAASVAAKVSAAFLAVVPGGKMILGITAAVAALVAGVVLLSNAYGENQKSMADLNKEYDDLMGQYEQTKVIDNTIQQYRELNKEMDGLTASGTGELLLKAVLEKEGFTTTDDLSVVTELSGMIENKKGELKQILTLNGAKDITDEELDRVIRMAANVETKEGELKQQLALLGIENISDEDLQLIRDVAAEIVTAEGTLSQTVVVNGTEMITGDVIKKIQDLDGAIATASGELKQVLTVAGAGEVNDDTLARIIRFGSVIEDRSGNLKQALEIAGAKNVTDKDIEKIGKLSSKIQTAEGSLKQALAIVGAGEVTDENIAKIASLAGKISTNSGALKQVMEILGVENASPENIQRIANMAKEVTSAKGELKQTLTLLGAKNASPETIAMIVDFAAEIQTNEGQLQEVLSVLGIENASPETIEKIKNLAAQISTDEGTLAETLALTGFENYDAMVAALSLTDDVKDADASSTISLTVTDNGSGQQTIDTLGRLQSKVDETKAKLDAVSEEYEQARSMLEAMQSRYDELAARMKYAPDDKTKKTIAEEMQDLSEEISKKETEVGDLQGKYNTLALTYQAASDAAALLQSKEQERIATMNELRESSNGIITATNEETEAFERQLAVVEKINEARQIEVLAKAEKNMAQQAGKYVVSLGEEQAARERLNAATQKQGQYMDLVTKGSDELKTRLGEIIDTIQGIGEETGSIDWNTEEVVALRKEAEAIGSVLNGGKTVDYTGTGLSGMVADLETAQMTASGTEQMIVQAGKEVQEYDAQVRAALEIQKMFVDNVVDMVTSGGMSMERARALLSEQFAGYENGGAIVERIMNQVTQAINGADQAAAEAAGNAGKNAAEVEDTLKPMIEYMEELGKAYDEVYKAAYESISGQLSLFGEAPKMEEKSVDKMIENLKAQKQYLDEYVSNLNAVKEMKLNEAIIAQLSDGSAESAAYLAEIVKDGAGKIDELNTAFQGVEKGKEDFAKTVAEMQTDFSSKMEEMQGIVESTVKDMDMSGEATAAARSTMQAFADGATGMTDTVKKAFEKVAAAAAAALNVNVGGGGEGGGGTTGGHAAGTWNAPRGFSMVGEQGPELVYFHGGEQVLNARETSKALMGLGSGGGTSIMIEPIYNITGTGSNTELREILFEQNRNLRDTIEDILADIESDRARSVYS